MIPYVYEHASQIASGRVLVLGGDNFCATGLSLDVDTRVEAG